MTRPPASGMALRTSVSRWSAARSTFGIHSPRGSSAVRQAWRDRVLGHRLAEPGRDLVARLGAPAHVAAVGEEDDGPHDAVAERVAVAVGVVGGGAPDAVVALLVRRRTGSGWCRTGRAYRSARAAGWRARTPPGTPRPRTCESPAWWISSRMTRVLRCSMRLRCSIGPHADTRVGDGDAVVLLAERPRAVLRVELDPYPRGRLRPLLLQMLGRRDDGHLLHDVVVQQPGGERERERRLAGAGGGDGEEVTRLLLDVARPSPPCCQARSLLAVPQGARPGKAGERWW